MKTDYEDIMYLPHHVSLTRPRMAMKDRAAQFSPFAALQGYEEAIKERNRLTERRVELDEYEKEEIGRKLCVLAEQIKERLPVELTYFQKDSLKEGGTYLYKTGIVKKLNHEEQKILLEDGTEVPFHEIIQLHIKT